MNSREQFVNWVKQNDPFLYSIAEKRALLDQRGMGTINVSGIFDKLVNTVKSVVPQIQEYRTQKRILDLQIKRANQGLPPANLSVMSTPSFNPDAPPPKNTYIPLAPINSQNTVEFDDSSTAIAEEKERGKGQGMILGVSALALILLMRRR